MEYPKLLDSIGKSSFTILADVLVFALGSTFYGAVTGAAVTWVMHRKRTKE